MMNEKIRIIFEKILERGVDTDAKIKKTDKKIRIISGKILKKNSDFDFETEKKKDDSVFPLYEKQTPLKLSVHKKEALIISVISYFLIGLMFYIIEKPKVFSKVLISIAVIILIWFGIVLIDISVYKRVWP